MIGTIPNRTMAAAVLWKFFQVERLFGGSNVAHAEEGESPVAGGAGVAKECVNVSSWRFLCMPASVWSVAS